LSGSARPLDPLLWIGLPSALVVLATFLLLAPVRVFGLPLPEPVVALVPAFAWAVIRPSILAPFALLLVGLVMDVLWGSTLGLWPLALLLAYGVIFSVRTFLAGRGHWFMLAWYILVCGLSEMMAFLVTRIAAGSTPNLLGMFWQTLATVLLFPFAYLLVDRFEDADVRFR
jgi:rod shape-determining protein MreD